MLSPSMTPSSTSEEGDMDCCLNDLKDVACLISSLPTSPSCEQIRKSSHHITAIISALSHYDSSFPLKFCDYHRQSNGVHVSEPPTPLETPSEIQSHPKSTQQPFGSPIPLSISSISQPSIMQDEDENEGEDGEGERGGEGEGQGQETREDQGTDRTKNRKRKIQNSKQGNNKRRRQPAKISKLFLSDFGICSKSPTSLQSSASPVSLDQWYGPLSQLIRTGNDWDQKGYMSVLLPRINNSDVDIPNGFKVPMCLQQGASQKSSSIDQLEKELATFSHRHFNRAIIDLFTTSNSPLNLKQFEESLRQRTHRALYTNDLDPKDKEVQILLNHFKLVSYTSGLDHGGWSISNDDHDDRHIAGVTREYWYLGQPGSAFPFHLEDERLASFNLHYGEKDWIIIHSDSRVKFEQLLAAHCSSRGNKPECSQFARHMSCWVFTDVLDSHNIRYDIVEQRAGQALIIGPETYHAGFSKTPSIGEAVNRPIDWKCDEYLYCSARCREVYGQLGSNYQSKSGETLFA